MKWRCSTWWVDAAAATGTGPGGQLLDAESWLACGWVAGARARLVVLSVPEVDFMA